LFLRFTPAMPWSECVGRVEQSVHGLRILARIRLSLRGLRRRS